MCVLLLLLPPPPVQKYLSSGQGIVVRCLGRAGVASAVKYVVALRQQAAAAAGGQQQVSRDGCEGSSSPRVQAGRGENGARQRR